MEITNRFKFLLYILLRNDIGWKIWSQKQRDKIIATNSQYNSERPDYADAKSYGVIRMSGGEIWESDLNRFSRKRGKFILENMMKYSPNAVLEVGPGPGFFTKNISEFPFVKKYRGIEVGISFVNYLKEMFGSLKRDDLDWKILHGSAPADMPEGKFDAILLVSVVHHIPNRKDLFKKLCYSLNENGIIICVEPTHYLWRYICLIKKCIFNGYLRKRNYEDLATHHFCTLGEFKNICKHVKELVIINQYYLPTKRLRWLSFLFPKLCCDEMGIIFKKKPLSD